VSILDRKQTIRLRQKLAAHGVTIKKGLRISQQASWRQVMAQVCRAGQIPCVQKWAVGKAQAHI